MKKLFAMLMTSIFLFTAVACGEGQGSSPESAASPENSLALLDTVWDTYHDDEKFPVAGGDFSGENANMEGPGKYSMEDPEALDAALGFPAGYIERIEDAASLMHMMNANNFTCGVYHVKDSAAVSEVVSVLESNIKARQWMCGFPDKLLIMTVGDYVIAAFGSEELLDGFKEKTSEAFGNAETVCYDPIA